jgi:DNA-binding GntR family transcriptional regulator
MPDDRTLTAVVFDKIREDILEGRLAPGTRLRLNALAQQHGVSPTVVREVLTRLSEQGLVLSRPLIGFCVVSLSHEDLEDLAETRVEIEGLAVRRSVEKGDLSWESRLVAAHHVLARTPVKTSHGAIFDREWEVAHAEFHRALMTGSGRPRLAAIAVSLWDASGLYRRWSQSFDPERALPQEHAAILQAALSRDAALTESLLAAHISRTMDALRKGLMMTADEPDSDADEAI